MPPTKLQRWLDLIAYLVGRRVPVTVEELMEKIPTYANKWKTGDATDQATARRTFERDKDELRASGIPLRTVKYTVDGEDVEGYEITKRDFYLPYLKLVTGAPTGARRFQPRHRAAEFEIAQGDAPLALEALRRIARIPSFPLREEARSAYRKLAFDLDPDAFAQGPAVLFFEPPGAPELSTRLREITDALLARKRVKFRYRGMYRGEETSRDVAPYGILFQQGNWYLIGHDAMRADLRVFRVARMDDIDVNQAAPNTADYDIPGDFRLRDYVGRPAWELGNSDEETLAAQVLFQFPQSVWADRNEYGELLETRPDGSAIRSFDVQQVNPFLRWVLSLEGDAEIVSPAELRTQLRELASAVANVHREKQ